MALYSHERKMTKNNMKICWNHNSDKDKCKYNTVKAIVSYFPRNSLKWSQLNLVWLWEEALISDHLTNFLRVPAYKSFSIQGLHQTLYVTVQAGFSQCWL